MSALSASSPPGGLPSRALGQLTNSAAEDDCFPAGDVGRSSQPVWGCVQTGVHSCCALCFYPGLPSLELPGCPACTGLQAANLEADPGPDLPT